MSKIIIDERQALTIRENIGKAIDNLNKFRDKLLSTKPEVDMELIANVSFNIGELKSLKRFFGGKEE